MDEILLGQLHQEISVELDVEVKVAGGGLGILNVKIQGEVKQSDCFSLVSLQTPLDLSLKESVFLGLLLGLTDLCQKFKLLACILDLTLLNLAVNHSVKRLEILLILLSCS